MSATAHDIADTPTYPSAVVQDTADILGATAHDPTEIRAPRRMTQPIHERDMHEAADKTECYNARHT